MSLLHFNQHLQNVPGSWLKIKVGGLLAELQGKQELMISPVNSHAQLQVRE